MKKQGIEDRKSESYGLSKDQMIELMERMNKGLKDNLESRRSALNTLVGAFPVEVKFLPLFLWMNYILINLINVLCRIM